jgi:hypothetical protein
VTVWVVLRWRAHEGYDAPLGVYASQDLAEKACPPKRYEAEWGIAGGDILEYQVQDDGY